MAQPNETSCFVHYMMVSTAMTANEGKQASKNEAHKSIDYTKGNIHIANNELIWQTP